LDALAARHPGGDVELRVPPFAAVQAGSGERGAHTRGTPPNIVETDAETLFALATGLTTWNQAKRDHRLSASGPHSDLANWLPLPT
jgi:hypothetical protein